MKNQEYVLRSPTPVRRTALVLINRKKITCNRAGFVVTVYQRMKLKESKIKDKYLYLGWESKYLWNMKVKLIAIVVVAFLTVTKGLEKKDDENGVLKK